MTISRQPPRDGTCAGNASFPYHWFPQELPYRIYSGGSSHLMCCSPELLCTRTSTCFQLRFATRCVNRPPCEVLRLVVAVLIRSRYLYDQDLDSGSLFISQRFVSRRSIHAAHLWSHVTLLSKK
ncbi:hypothetical protein EDEG_02231 [Edhazardia aedis USNM 41457]|uniref:Uncharacterized protein n=1 Tax=Edhazardia aedis (strain USNM 41457) TaxID=1003232 RepID=J9D6Q6_EDHAE|nr:hypothetical protein EDEG_02231 [Edhazardia aedis USNM 41457]|eukprot:EJW03466.1 hypothetical protein EDEG_02231 [Edhazardia aedis USNM 41457]